MGFKDEEFPETKVKDTSNYCRSPDSDTQPWCFVDDEEGSGVSSVYCDVPLCGGIFNRFKTIILQSKCYKKLHHVIVIYCSKDPVSYLCRKRRLSKIRHG